MVDIFIFCRHIQDWLEQLKKKKKIVQTVSGGEDEEVFMVITLYHIFRAVLCWTVHIVR